MKTELNTINDCAAEQLYPLPPKITAAFYLGLVAKGNMVATRALPGEVSGWLLVISERQDYMISQAEFERAQVELDVQRAHIIVALHHLLALIALLEVIAQKTQPPTLHAP
jgi:hypothetical protein